MVWEAAAVAAGAWADEKEVVLLPVLPARLLITLMAVAVVAATARLGHVLGDAPGGLVAALFLAVSPLHVELSQLVRTDIMVSLAGVIAMLAAVRIANAGKRRDIIVGGLWIGAAVATKWPGAFFAMAPLGAIWLHHGNDRVTLMRHAALFVLVMTLTVLVLMPPLWLQPTAVWAALLREAAPAHVGATGSGFWGNLVWYVGHALVRALDWVGVALAAAGLGLVAWRRDRRILVVVVLPSLVLLLVFASQANVWQRWLVPLLPTAALLAGFALMTMMRRLLPAQMPRAGILAAVLLAIPLAMTTWGEGRARGNPTEARAVTWALANIPPGASVTTEMLAFPLLGGGWQIRFPLGMLGCPDGRALLAGKVNFNDASHAQAGRQKIVLGTVLPGKLADCWSDYVIVHDQDRWLAERRQYPKEAAIYETLLARGRIVAEFRPEPGRSSGPRTLIVQLSQSKGNTR